MRTHCWKLLRSDLITHIFITRQSSKWTPTSLQAHSPRPTPLPFIWCVLVVHHFRFRRTDVLFNCQHSFSGISTRFYTPYLLLTTRIRVFWLFLIANKCIWIVSDCLHTFTASRTHFHEFSCVLTRFQISTPVAHIQQITPTFDYFRRFSTIFNCFRPFSITSTCFEPQDMSSHHFYSFPTILNYFHSFSTVPNYSYPFSTPSS